MVNYFLGLDLGSSSVKCAIVDEHGNTVGNGKFPEKEMVIDAPKAGWAEQNPDDWWNYVLEAIKLALVDAPAVKAQNIKSIGISYQMHGLVVVDDQGKPLRPSIIWCDSRAVEVGNETFDAMGRQFCLDHCLNSPANFTASKLKWVKDNEPEIYNKIHKAMLPGDFIAYKMSGKITTSVSGLSEGIFWDFKTDSVSVDLLNTMGISPDLLAPPSNSFEASSLTNELFAELTGIQPGTPISYRAGDQPNNALALAVLEDGEAAGTGGTSGVVYAVSKSVVPDAQSRVNCFAHVNHTSEDPHIGTLLCINGTGILYNWLRTNFYADRAYPELEKIASEVTKGAEGVRVYSFGNGAERMLGNANPGATIKGLDFNRHTRKHILRAGLEGIAFAFAYGLEVMKEMGIEVRKMKVGDDNLFQSKVFGQTLADVAGVEIEVYHTNGAAGAAKGSAFGAGYFSNLREAVSNIHQVNEYSPSIDAELVEIYKDWKKGIAQ